MLRLELELFEPVQFVLDALFVGPGRTASDPGPALNQQRLRLAIRLEIDRGDNLIADKNRQGKIPNTRFSFGT